MKKEEREERHSRWLEEETVLDMDWTDPVIDMSRMSKQSEARRKLEHFLCTATVKSMVLEMVEETPAASDVGMIIKEAAKTGMTEKIWKELEKDDDILKRIIKKLEDRDNRKRLEKADEDRKSRLEIKQVRARNGWKGGGWTIYWRG